MAVNYKAAGRIVGNPLCGLNDRICIEVRQVYDACIRRENNINATLVFSDFTAGAPEIINSIMSVEPVTVSELSVVTGDNCSQVALTVNVPLVMTYHNAACQCGTARAVLRYRRNVALRVPEGTVLPFTVEAVSVVRCDIATYAGDGIVNFTYCIMDIVKGIVPVDILVPTYGYAVYPECTECGVCPGITEGPLFPTR